MAVRIGSARINEKGTTTEEKPEIRPVEKCLYRITICTEKVGT